MIEFDKYGNLFPYEIVETDLITVEKHFVGGMRNKNYRHQIFDNYLKYITELNKLIDGNYFQWINGSFVTKKLRPNDIDIVSFCDYRLVEKVKSEIKFLMYPFSKSKYEVDAYIVKTYPFDHKSHKFYESDKLYWLHQFLKTKPNKQGRQMNKGFLKIDMNHEILKQ
jgi:hypothetical protein